MAQTAMHLVEEVFPLLPVRQYVLSLPKMIRFYVARNNELLGKVLKIFTQEIERELKKLLLELSGTAKLGAVTFIQRFGSSLNHHVHYHTCVIDGLFYTDDSQEVTTHPSVI